MRVAYFDCFSGVAGDMTVAALIGAGVPKDEVIGFVEGMGLDGYRLSIENVKRQGLSASHFRVDLDATVRQPHRHLSHVLALLDQASMPDSIRRRAGDVFRRLAQAEADVHGCSIEQVHFHEVGAVDAIIDITAAVFALERLEVRQVICSPIPAGRGTVCGEHGVMPVPAPATAHLLKNVPLASCDVEGELTTPTGAALMTTLADRFGSLPAMTVQAIGYGAGRRDSKERANVLRVFVGELGEVGSADEVVTLEANLDDTTAEVVAYCMERLLNRGALDVYTVPITMKKGRSGLMLCAIAAVSKADELETIIFEETTTFGVRRVPSRRRKLQRSHHEVETPFGPIRVKVGVDGAVKTASPEYEDCRQAALHYKVSMRTVMEAARSAWSRANAS